jgi:hypothetical protein
MKTIIMGALIAATFTFAACNNNHASHEAHNHDTMAMAGAAMKPPAASADEAITTVPPQFTNLDAAAAASLKTITGHYLQIKNGLAADNASDAANGGKAMAAAMEKIAVATLTTAQQKIYKENEEDLKEHAEHIGKNDGNIAHQREHFAQMSEDVYALVKAFGGGQALYHDYCPMYNDNKGALWLSEAKDIRNPYFGTKMPGCGSVKEMIQ